jgi:hypothetical protein
MNISSSISQVIYQTQLPGRILLKKAFMWPEYNAGKVHSISPIHEKQEPNFSYIKRSDFSPENESIALKSGGGSEYNSKGDMFNILNNYTPGSNFEAYA